jgi:hypothetical protein
LSARVQLQGVQELRAALRNLPSDLAQEADVVIRATAEDMARAATSAYPEGPTGNLKRGVTVETNSSRFGIGAIVRSRAKHASIFERGTQVRRTGKGWNRGAMPQPPESERFIPKAIRSRRRMTQALIDIVRKAGFEVDA